MSARSPERAFHTSAEIKGANDSMKQIKAIVLAAASLLAFTAFAQQSNPPAQSGGDQSQGPRRGMASVDDQLKMMSERLSLTADQQAKIKPILEDRSQQIQALMKDDTLSQDDRRTKARGIQEASASKIRDVLTDDQKKKFDEMQQEMRDRMRQRQSGGDSNPK
jgi:periplasmic protein CpxP/Spy